MPELFRGFSQKVFKYKVRASKTYGAVVIVGADNEDYITAYLKVASENNSTDDIGVTRVDKNGKSIWDKIYGTSLTESTPRLLATSNNGFVIFAKSYDPPKPKEYSAIIFKCDSLGNIEWSKKISAEQGDFNLIPIQIIEDAEGNFVLLYQIELHNEIQIQLLKFNKKGDFIFQTGFKNLYDYRESQYFKTNSITVSNNGDFLVAFLYSCSLCQNGPRSYFVRISKDGIPYSYKRAGPDLHSYYDYYRPLLVFQKNSKDCVLGYFYDATKNIAGEDPNSYYYASFDATSITDTAYLFPYNNFVLQKFCSENDIDFPIKIGGNPVLFDKKKNMILPTYLPTGTSSNKSFIINKYDSLGRICPNFILPSYVYDTSSRPFVFSSEIGGITINTKPIKVKDILLSVTNEDVSNLDCSDIVPTISYLFSEEKNILPSSTKPSLSPNPAKSSITISMFSESAKFAQITISDINGRTVQSLKASLAAGHNKKTIDIVELKSGLYFVKINDGQKLTVLKFVKY